MHYKNLRFECVNFKNRRIRSFVLMEQQLLEICAAEDDLDHQTQSILTSCLLKCVSHILHYTATLRLQLKQDQESGEKLDSIAHDALVQRSREEI